MKKDQLPNSSKDIAVRFKYMHFDSDTEWLGAYGQAMWLHEFKRFCRTALSRNAKVSDYFPWDISCMDVYLSDGRRFIWQAPILKADGTWTQAWTQVANFEPWEPYYYGILPF